MDRHLHRDPGNLPGGQPAIQPGLDMHLPLRLRRPHRGQRGNGGDLPAAQRPARAGLDVAEGKLEEREPAKSGAIPSSAAITFSPAAPLIASGARPPRSSRVSVCMAMVLRPLLRCGIAADLGVEDDKAGPRIGQMRTPPAAVPLRERALLGTGMVPLGAEPRMAQHFADRHAGDLQPVEAGDPDEDRLIAVAPAARIAIRSQWRMAWADRPVRSARSPIFILPCLPSRRRRPWGGERAPNQGPPTGRGHEKGPRGGL